MMVSKIFERLSAYLRMIKFSHSVFALPFALTSAFIASDGFPELEKFIWIVIAMVSARTAAMGLNRIIDRHIDKANPRTSMREIPSGKVSTLEASGLVLIATAFFILSAWKLNPLCFKLSFLALGFIFLYSYTKRFTSLSHLFLGVTISAAPLGAWIAVTGSFDPRILSLGFSVALWIAGFDILYALQDVDFDRKYGLYSIPARLGISRAILISRIFHIISWSLLFMTGLLFELRSWFFGGVVFAGLILFYEHRLVRPDDLSRLNIAFFNMNGYLSLVVLVFTLISYIT
ncbi:MAG: putative 4-hydroxybenzoate polyprenyltransferase [Thermodesulfovibrionales bacterium]|nr:putative 4-hydroxybenzoate polyprenyltransferase [Thermodesulfovibrionales bacterium]